MTFDPTVLKSSLPTASDAYDADVVIVGAGPVGEYLALLLGRLGFSAIVVERQPRRYPLPRAVTFDDEIARLFSSIGIDADNDPLIERTDDWYLLRNAERETIAAFDWRGVTAAGWHRLYWFHQPDLEQRLARMIAEVPTIEIRQPWQASSVAQDEDGVTVTCRVPQSPTDTQAGWFLDSSVDSREETIRGRYLVGADGANSFVRSAANLPVTDLGFFFDWLIVDIVPSTPMTFDPPVWQLCDPSRPTTIVPGGPGRRRWEFMALPGEDLSQLNTPAAAWRLLESWGVRPDNATLERHTVWRFQAKWAEKWHSGRVFIAGDAAHLMPPFAGQGMCAGIRDATNLAWRLDLVLRGVAGAHLLHSYGSERREHVRHFVNLSMTIGEAICVLDPDAARERDNAMKAALDDPSLAPPPPPPLSLGPGVWRPNDPQAGKPSTQGIVTAAGRTGRLEEIVGRGWLLLGWENEPLEALTPSQRDLFSALNGTAVSMGTSGEVKARDVDGTYQAWFAELGAEVVLIRPDCYVAVATSLVELRSAFAEIADRLAITASATAVR